MSRRFTKRRPPIRPRPKMTRMQGFFMSAQAGYGFVRTNMRGWPDIFIPSDKVNDARGSDWVEVGVFGELEPDKISRESRISGTVLRILQHVEPETLADGSGADMQLIMRQFGLPQDFPDEVLQEAAAVPQQVSPGELAGRRDCRDWPLVTIDGVDSRDFDDAVYCRRLPEGNFFLSVHIADVAHYVPVRSALENEAFARATSVYLPDRVIPMLPVQLSNGICSLNAGQDRLTLACDMEYTPRGRLVRHEIYEGVINVHQRLDYDTVNAALLDNDPQAQAAIQEQLPMLQELAELQKLLAAKHKRRGALTFEFPELKLSLNQAGQVATVEKHYSRLAEKMIEQAMLAANETVAEHFHRLGLPFVYRVHEGPSPERLTELNDILQALDLTPLTGANPRDLQKALIEAEELGQTDFVQLLILRSLSHASYAAKLGRHFGLAAKHYCHFTSPIRRYPDLAVHRIIKRFLHSSKAQVTTRKMQAYTEAVAQQASEREINAEEVERAAVKLKCCLFLRDKVGQSFAARVSGVTPKSIFVALENGIEGRIGLEDLPPDSYQFVEQFMVLLGKRNSYGIGQPLRVRLKEVDLLARRISFQQEEE